jgi:hypothetical protein
MDLGGFFIIRREGTWYIDWFTYSTLVQVDPKMSDSVSVSET